MKSSGLAITCVVPIKSLRTAKSRLAPILGETARTQLVLEMLRHTLEVTGIVPAIQRRIVLSPDERIGELTASMGADFLLEPDGPGLNAALEYARWKIQVPDALLILPGDLPLVTAADVELLLLSGRSEVNLVLAADSVDRGTNALYMSPLFEIPFCFGEGSLGKHILAGCRQGADVLIVRTPGLGMDVDTPEDYLKILPLSTL